MPASYTYPKSLLHSSTEKQWFPPTKKEITPKLTTLEDAEEAYQQRLADILNQTESVANPVVIGKDPATNNNNNGGRRSSRGDSSTVNEADDVSTVVMQRPIRPTTLFWNRERD